MSTEPNRGIAAADSSGVEEILRGRNSLRRVADWAGSARGLAASGLLVISVIALWFRIAELDSVYWFAGDQGSQSIVVREIVLGKKVHLLGAWHSYGGWNYGPAYYYLNVPAYILLDGDERFGAATQIFLGILSLLLIYRTVRLCRGGRCAGLMAAFILAVSPQAVINDRMMWNPNLMPFFTLAACWYSMKIVRGKGWPLTPLVLIFAVLTQLHMGGFPVAAGVAAALILHGMTRVTRWLVRRQNLPQRDDAAPRGEPSSPRRAGLWVDLTGVCVILAASMILWTHAEAAKPDWVREPFSLGTDMISRMLHNAWQSVLCVAQFVSKMVFCKVQPHHSIVWAFWVLTGLLFVWRLVGADRLTRWFFLQALLILGGFAGAFCCLMQPPLPYIITGLQSILPALLAMIWLGAPLPVRRGSRWARALFTAPFAIPLIVLGIAGASYLQRDLLTGRDWPQHHYLYSKAIADWIAADSRGESFALGLLAGGGDSRDYIRYLLIRRGTDCTNSLRREPAPEDAAQRVYLVYRQWPRRQRDWPCIGQLLGGSRRLCHPLGELDGVIRVDFDGLDEAYVFLKKMRQQKKEPMD